VIDQYPSANGVLTSLIWRKTASGGETSLSGYDNANQALSYTPGQEQVYLNGILLVRGDDYTATNGTSITGLSALSASDFVQVNCYNNFSVASLPTSGLVGTISNAQLQNSSITINGSAISLGGSVSLPGDIESVTASSPLTGGGTSGAITIGIQSASTTQSGAVQLSDSTSTTSSILAATPTAVKSAYDLANAAIPKNLTTTTGDIIYASAANTPARLGIGSSGQVLTVSGGIPAWTTAASGTATNWTLLNAGGTALTGATKITVSFTAPKQLLVLMVDASSANSRSFITIRPNDVSTADYSIGGSAWIYTDQFGTTVSNSGGTGAYSSNTDIPFGTMGTGAAAKAHGTLFMDLTDKTGNKYYNVQAGGTYDAATAGQILYAAQGLFESSSTITSIAVLSSTGNFDAGTLYVFGAN
jgi:Phage tail fibre repeat